MKVFIKLDFKKKLLGLCDLENQVKPLFLENNFLKLDLELRTFL